MKATTRGSSSVRGTGPGTMQLTATPSAGFASIDAATPGWLFVNQQHDQLGAWADFAGEKVITSIFGHGALDHKVDDSLISPIGIIETTAAQFIDSTNIRASPPIAINQPTVLNAAPYGILLYNLTKAQAEALLNRRCISTPDISLFFFPFAVELPRLILSFGGIPNRTNEEVRRMAVVNLRSEYSQKVLLDLIARNPELTAKHSAKRAANKIVQSTVITQSAYFARRAVAMPVFNLFVDIPVSSAAEWIRWRDAFRAMPWADNDLGAVTVRGVDEVRCVGCQANTHFFWDCPFLGLQDWHGSIPEPAAKRTANPNARRGGLGRGGGRVFGTASTNERTRG